MASSMGNIEAGKDYTVGDKTFRFYESERVMLDHGGRRYSILTTTLHEPSSAKVDTICQGLLQKGLQVTQYTMDVASGKTDIIALRETAEEEEPEILEEAGTVEIGKLYDIKGAKEPISFTNTTETTTDTDGNKYRIVASNQRFDNEATAHEIASIFRENGYSITVDFIKSEQGNWWELVQLVPLTKPEEDVAYKSGWAGGNISFEPIEFTDESRATYKALVAVLPYDLHVLGLYQR